MGIKSMKLVFVSIIFCVAAHAQGDVTFPNIFGPFTAPGEFAPSFLAYVSNQGSASISGYSVNIPSGALTSLSGSPFAAPAATVGIAIDPNGRCAVGAGTSGSIQSYIVDPSSGSLTPSGAPIPFTGANRVAFEPGDRFVYVDSTSTGISGFRLGSPDCGLTPISGSPFAAPSLSGMSVDPTGRWLYAARFATPGFVYGFSIDQVSGAPTPIAGSPFAAGNNTNFVAITPSGSYLYATNNGSNTISAYTINPATGILTAIAGSPFPTSTGPRGLTIHPSGNWLYNANDTDNVISEFSINPVTGLLAPLSGSPVAMPGGATSPFDVAIEPIGHFLYSANQGSSNVSGFAINLSTGMLIPVASPGPNFPAGGGPTIVFAATSSLYQNNLFFGWFFSE